MDSSWACTLHSNFLHELCRMWLVRAVGVLGGAFPLHAQHRALRGPPRGFGIMRMCSSYLVSNHSYNLTCSQGETDAPRSRSSRSVDTRPDTRSVDTRPDTRWLLSAHYWRTAVCLLAARKVCSPTRSDASKKRQCAFWCIRSVARRCVLLVSFKVVMSRPGQQMTQSQALDGRGTPRSNARLHLLVRRACAHVVSRTCYW